jgi:hypothetical protein
MSLNSKIFVGRVGGWWKQNRKAEDIRNDSRTFFRSSCICNVVNLDFVVLGHVSSTSFPTSMSFTFLVNLVLFRPLRGESRNL